MDLYYYCFAASNGEFSENLDKTYYVYLPPELCLVHPLPGSLVRGAQRLPSIMRRVESMLLAIQLKDIIGYPVPANKVHLQLSIVHVLGKTFECPPVEFTGKWNT